MRLIDEATGIVYRTLEQGEVLTYRGSFKDCFEARHSLVKTGEKCEGWQLDSPLEALQRATPPQGIKSRVALELEEEHQENLAKYASAQIDVNALAKAKEDKNSFVNAIPQDFKDMIARQRELELAQMMSDRVAELERKVAALSDFAERLSFKTNFF